MKKWYIFGLFGAIALTLAIVSCNRDFDTRIDTSSIPDTTVHNASSQNKVLYIIVDGGIGQVIADQSVRDNIYPNINTLTQTAIFSAASLSDSNNIDATTYADMFTGVHKSKHGVLSASGSNNLSQYSSFVDDLTAVNANYKTSAFVQAPFIYNALVNGAATKQLLSTDQAIEEAAISDIATTTSSVVVAQYMGLKVAGDANGYGPNSQAYLNALQSFDGFLGSLLNAVKNRSSVAFENWVVIIASNKGGKYALGENEDYGGEFSDPERDGFIIISNPNFNLDYYPVPNIKDYTVSGTSPEELGPEENQGEVDEDLADIYNFGTSGNYTVQFKANISNRSTSSTIPSIVAKSNSSSGNSPTTGWSFVLSADGGKTNWTFRFAGTNNTGPSFDLNIWNTFAAVLYDSASKRYIRTYLNGVSVSAPSDITGKSGTTLSKLIIGGGPSYGANSFIGRIFDVRIYNTALPQPYLLENYCKTYVNQNEPYAENLIGYWPGFGSSSRESSEKIFLDYSPNKRDIKFGADAQWGDLNVTAGNNVCPVFPDYERYEIPYSVDIPRFIYTWLNIFNIAPYDLDSKIIVPTYRSGEVTN